MTPAAWHVWVEAAQAAVALVGLATAALEWRAIAALGQVGHTLREKYWARHLMFIEILRCVVHGVVLVTASLSLWMPTVPATMGDDLAWQLLLRKLGVLVIATIACAGTVSSRRARLRAQRAGR